MDSLPARAPAERIALVDLLDRLLADGVVVSGEITLSVADVDLVTISLRALLASVSSLDAYSGAEPTTQSRQRLSPTQEEVPGDAASPVPARR